MDKIFQCKFVEENISNEVEREEDELRTKKRYWYKVYKIHSIFKDPIKVFQEKNIENLNFFHLNIVISISWYNFNFNFDCLVFDYYYNYDYLFYKTKENKYLFKTVFEENLMAMKMIYINGKNQVLDIEKQKDLKIFILLTIK